MNAMQEQLTPYKTPFHKYRVGRDGDGGYILLRELLEASPVVYSYGIGNEASFDETCCRLGKRVFMYDPSISCAPNQAANMVFQALPFSAAFLEHIVQNGHLAETNMTLKVDVEGHEWNALMSCDASVFERFSQMVIEFHGLSGSERQRAIMSRILSRHVVTHIHANNHMGINLTPEGWPDILEISFARRDCVPSLVKEDCSYPLAGLDFPNVPQNTDYNLNWWLP